MNTLYGDEVSGNSYKVKLVCELLGLDYNWIDIDLLTNENRNDDFLQINPLGQVPVLVVAPDSKLKGSQQKSTILLESAAIIRYLAEGSVLIPSDTIQYAKMWQWLIYEQTQVRPNIGAVRYIKKFQDMIPARAEEYKHKLEASKKVLIYLNERLARRPFILGVQVSLADISLYAYTHVAEDGGLNMTEFKNLSVWFKRIEAMPGYISIKR